MVGLLGGSWIGTGICATDQSGGQGDVPMMRYCHSGMSCYRLQCELDDGCPLKKRMANLKRIAPACIKTPIKPKEKKKPIGPGRSYFHEHPVGLLENISMRQVVYKFEGITVKQALEILTNGDCSTER